jgi:hypothetical protein
MLEQRYKGQSNAGAALAGGERSLEQQGIG